MSGQGLVFAYAGAGLLVGLVALLWGDQKKIAGAGLVLASVLVSNIIDALLWRGQVSLRHMALLYAAIDLALVAAFSDLYRRATPLARARWAGAAALVHLAMAIANIMAAAFPAFAARPAYAATLNALLVGALLACLAGAAPRNPRQAFAVLRLKAMYFLSDWFGRTLVLQRTGTRGVKRKRGDKALDIHIGAKVREARIMLDLGREDLAAAMGVTVAQVQKYETGATRLSASTLYELAAYLKQDYTFFFADYRPAPASRRRALAR